MWGTLAAMAKAKRKRFKRRRRRMTENPARSNPPLMTDLLEYAGPGFAAFAGTRFLTRIAMTQLAKWKPGLGKHAGAATSVGTFLAVWLLGHKVKIVEKYHTPVVVGAAIAMAQSLLQIYFPQLGWIVADATPDLALPAAPANTQLAIAQLDLRPTDDDPNEFTYNDEYDAGRMTPVRSGAGGGAQVDINDLAIDDAVGQATSSGVFSN